MFKGILLTFLTGAFFLIGIISIKKIKNKENISLFTIALGFVVLLGLILFDLLPEIISACDLYSVLAIIFGFLILVVLDKFIPHHHHNHHEKNDDLEDHELHLNHIGIITIIALTIHNLLEGLTLYNLTISDFKSGLLMMISISLHNIPLGFQIGNSISLKKNWLLILLLVCSSLIGGLIIIIFGNFNILIENILLSITFGMLLYILIFELSSEMMKSIKKKSTIYGIIVGVIILLITRFI